MEELLNRDGCQAADSKQYPIISIRRCSWKVKSDAFLVRMGHTNRIDFDKFWQVC